MNDQKNVRFQERIIFGVIIMTGVAAFAMSLPMPGNAPVFPRIASTLLFLLGVALMVRSFRDEKKGIPSEVPMLRMAEMASPGVIFVITVLYAVSFRYIGFYVSTAVMVAAEMYFMGIRSLKIFILVECVLLAFLYWLFTMQLGVLMPRGILF